MSDANNSLPERERVLLDAAEDVVTRWAVIRAAEGKLGGCGLPEAMKRLDLACDAYSPEEAAP